MTRIWREPFTSSANDMLSSSVDIVDISRTKMLFQPLAKSVQHDPNLILVMADSGYALSIVKETQYFITVEKHRTAFITDKENCSVANHVLDDLLILFGLRRVCDTHYVWTAHDYMLDIHVHDLSLAYHNQAALDQFIAHFARHNTKMNYLGFVNHFLGIEVQRDMSRGLLKISQAGYVDEMLQRLKMTDCHGRHST